jgi:Fur family ferric uptake transcriptional regulator
VGDNHHHFVCRTCGTTIDIDCAEGEAPCLTPQALPRGFAVDEAEVTYWGHCKDCTTRQRKDRRV